MKILFIIIALLFNDSLPQNTQNKDGNKYFVVLYTIGENWDTTKQTHEQLYFKKHSSHLVELRKNEIITIGGRYSDTGLIIIRATNEKEAHHLITKDVAIQNKLFKAEIFPFNPFYKGCIE
jgi:hypothetical protein